MHALDRVLYTALVVATLVAAPARSAEESVDAEPVADPSTAAPQNTDTDTGPDLDSGSGPGETVGEDVFPLPEFVATGKEIKAPPTIIVKEVTREDIDAWNAQDVGEALTWVPGINVQVGGNSSDARAWIRGFRDRDALVMFDGIPIASGFEGTIDLNEIATNAVAGINVMMAAPSVIYGPNGVAGVIDVVPQTEVFETFVDGAVQLGTDDRRLVRASAGGGDGNVSYSISAQHRSADDYSLSDDYVPDVNQSGGERVNSDFERNNLFLQINARETAIGHASAFFNYSDAEKGLPVEVVDDPDYQRLTKSQRQTLGLSNHFKGIPLSLKLWYNGLDTDLTVFTDDTFTDVDEIEVAEDYSTGARLYSSIDTHPNNTLVLAGGVQTDVYKTNDELEVGNRAELRTWMLAAEDQFWMTEELSLAVGLLYTYFDQTLLNKTLDEFNPQIALAWQASQAWAFHASAAQRTRFPKLRELYRRNSGNPDLGVQTANNYEIGATWQNTANINTYFALFRNDVDGLIERPDRDSIYLNLPETTTKGVEIATGGWVTEKVFTRFAYTYLDVEENLVDGTTRQLRSRPKNTVLFEFRYLFPRDVLFSFNSIYVSGLYDLDPDDVYTKLPSYFVGHAKLLWPFTPELAGYLSVANLADEDYEHRIGYPREGRWAAIGLTFDF
jgi:outer membrane cobalamin receptor